MRPGVSTQQNDDNGVSGKNGLFLDPKVTLDAPAGQDEGERTFLLWEAREPFSFGRRENLSPLGGERTFLL